MPPRLLTAYLTRGLVLWSLVRLVAQVGARSLHRILPDASPGTLAPLVITAALCTVDFYRRREQTLVRDLGVAPLAAITLSAIPALIGEAIRLGLYGP